jgi:CubicO group peptidase (beta-lactamase class C family)
MLKILSAAAVVALALAPGSTIAASKPDKALETIVRGEGATDPVAGAAVAVMIGDRLVYAGAAGCAEFRPDRPRKCARPLEPDMKVRVASISKMAATLGLMTLVDEGRVDLDADISTYLGWRLRNPNFPDRTITTRQLLAHLSSIRDPEAYWVDAPGLFQTFFAHNPAAFAAADANADKSPGQWFEYANLNYGLVAAVIEGASSERFDRFMSARLFQPLGLDVGYNWSGVSDAARAHGASLHRREGKIWRSSIDDAAMRAEKPAPFRAVDGLDRAAYAAAYKPGDNPTLFSPQGGLRASVKDLAVLVKALASRPEMTKPIWRFDAAKPNGRTEEDFFQAFGLGVQTVKGNAALLGEAQLVGHAGEAYGLYSGAWLLMADPAQGRESDIAIAFAVTGTSAEPGKSAHPSFNAVEERLLRLALNAAGVDAATGAKLPFDEAANARAAVDEAFAAAQSTGRNVLIVLGNNRCHDSRGLAAKFSYPSLAAIIKDSFHVVWVDVGRRDRNLDIARRFGVTEIIGTPTILVISPEGALLNEDSVSDWRTADSRTLDEAIAYFSQF